MKDFQFHSPTKIFFGSSHSEEVFTELKKISLNCLLVTGGGSVERLGYLDTVMKQLEIAGISCTHFSGIEPNPVSQTINKAAKEGKEKGITAVIALGGGSAMDAAKAIAGLIASEEEDIWPFVVGEPKMGSLASALPILAIPTTAATASEVTPYSVISNPEVRGKSPIAYEFLKPTLAWINPEFTTQLPATVTQDGAADILSHVLENYLLGGNASPLTDRYCEGIMQTVIETLPKVLKDPMNKDLRSSLLWCSTLALNGMQGVGREPSEFVLHAIEHTLSAFEHKLAHGRGLATLYPAYFRWLWNNDIAKDRLNQLGVRLFHIEESDVAGLQFIEEFEGWLKTNSLLQSAEDIGIEPEVFAQIAEQTIRVYGQNNMLGPVPQQGIQEILELTKMQSVK